VKGSGRLYTAGATAIIKTGSDELFYRQSAKYQDTIRGEFAVNLYNRAYIIYIGFLAAGIGGVRLLFFRSYFSEQLESEFISTKH
jgi:hypothetical protein